MEPTAPLTGPAREYWDRHAPRLAAAGVLTESDRDAMTLLCQTWARVQVLDQVEPGPDNYREAIQYTNAVKQYERLAKQFGLLPRERKAAKMSVEPAAKKDEFGL